jgi:hypothetical protein
MPQGENFWNPYRWVTVSSLPVQHDDPNYHHTLNGLSGRLWCELEALTPLLIGDGQARDIRFVRHRHNQRPYIPSTSLKGAIRSLAEVVGNATVPFPKVSVDRQHELAQARRNTAHGPQFDAVSRTFGYLHDSNVVAGLIHFSDAEIVEPVSPNQWPQYNRVVVGQPKPSHAAFYPGDDKRKFYHHHPGATQLTKAPIEITQVTNVRPAPPGTCFNFTVDFMNLRKAELNLLLYCLVLEEQVTVTLSPAALGRDEGQGDFRLEGPLRHKIGGAKPHGAGSVHIRVTKMELCTDAMARYQGGSATRTLEDPLLTPELDRRTASFCARTDQTIQELRAMLIYSTADPRSPIYYPTYGWFQGEKKKPPAKKTRLKPTI